MSSTLLFIQRYHQPLYRYARLHLKEERYCCRFVQDVFEAWYELKHEIAEKNQRKLLASLARQISARYSPQ